MITILNRRELTTTFSMEKISRITGRLDQERIPYRVRTVGRQNAALSGASRSRSGSFGINTDLERQYIIYVHRKDLEKAGRLLTGLK